MLIGETVKPQRILKDHALRFILSWWGLIFWSVLVVAITYGNALTFPFLADDFFQFPFVEEHSLAEIWQTAEGLQYFRPLTFTLWKVLKNVTGSHNPVLLHAFSLLLHLINGLMVGWLAGQLWSYQQDKNTWTAWLRRYLAVTLYLLFPFSYQAVSWIAAVMHPLTTFLLLLSIIGYLKFVDTGKLVWAMLSLLVAFLAPFAHEIGIIVAPIIIAIEFLRTGTNNSLSWRIGRAALWLLPTLLWWFIWRSVPAVNTGNLIADFGFTDLWRNSTYVLQAVAYPVTWLGTRLSQAFTPNEFIVVALLGVGALILAAAIQFRGGQRMSLLPWFWISIAVAPAILFIPFRWFSASPRVLMIASVGIAFLWTDVVMIVVENGLMGKKDNQFGLIMALVLVLAVISLSYVYIRKQTRMYRMAGDLLPQVAEMTRAANLAGDPAIFINFPSWLAPPQEDYALGEEGVLILGSYQELDGLVQVYSGRSGQIESISYHDIRAAVPYHVGVTGQGPDWNQQAMAGGQIFVTRYTGDYIKIQPAGLFVTNRSDLSPLARFGNLVTLLEVEISENQEELSLGLTWLVEGPVDEDVTVFVHLVDGDGQLITQNDGDPLAGTFPLWHWSKGTIVKDIRFLPHDEEANSILVGLYRRSTGERLPASNLAGQPWKDDAVQFKMQQ
jgi:hypothetical protein